MPTVFVYEWCCAFGAGGSLSREGRAMRDAVADDFRRLPGLTVVTLDHIRDPDRETPRFDAAVADCDAVLVVAPEVEGVLSDHCRRVRAAGKTCLGPSEAAVRQAADKLALAETWIAAGVPTPRTSPATHARPTLPAVCKPRFGAGSEWVMLLRGPDDLQRYADAVDSAENDLPTECIVQDFVPGVAASVAFLIGPAQTVPLLPTFQHLSDDGRFRYLGGELPIPPALAERAIALGRRAVECVPGLRGYVGVDLVLGDATDGSQDYAIEINPRLTTSYVGLRALAETNLAGAMLDVCAGRPVVVRWKPGRVRFTPDGEVQYDSSPTR